MEKHQPASAVMVVEEGESSRLYQILGVLIPQQQSAEAIGKKKIVAMVPFHLEI